MKRPERVPTWFLLFLLLYVFFSLFFMKIGGVRAEEDCTSWCKTNWTNRDIACSQCRIANSLEKIAEKMK